MAGKNDIAPKLPHHQSWGVQLHVCPCWDATRLSGLHGLFYSPFAYTTPFCAGRPREKPRRLSRRLASKKQQRQLGLYNLSTAGLT